ncbi:hypothetical protein ACFLX0_01790 [Chloroflexota bacterium]
MNKDKLNYFQPSIKRGKRHEFTSDKDRKGRRGNYNAILKVNDTERTREEVTLGAGDSEIVAFTIDMESEGNYTVNIGSQTAQVTVIAEPPEPLTIYKFITSQYTVRCQESHGILHMSGLG